MSTPAARSAARQVVPPIPFRWDGEHMTPVGRFAREADRYYVVGESYRLVEHQDRSQASHNHYFAIVAEAWANLPEHMAERFATPDALRKYALCKAGYADATQLVASSKAEAVRIASFIGSDADLVTVNGNIVTKLKAHSQSYQSMGKKAFQESKDAVLQICADMIGVTPEALASNAGRSA